MKKTFIIAILSCTIVLPACESDNDNESINPTLLKVEEILNNRTSEPDLTAFLETAQTGVWKYDELCLHYTNGETYDGVWSGGAPADYMMLLPDGECRIFLNLMFNPLIPMLYQKIEWSVSEEQPNTLELYSEKIEQDAETHHYDQYAARTTLQLLYYQDGVFIMKGMQPFAYGGGMTSKGIYKDYCTFIGHIDTDEETVAEYLGCELYEEYRAQHPDMFPDR